MSDIAPYRPQYRPRGRAWRKGQSGNPAGRRPGCRNKATVAVELYLDGEAPGLLRKAVELAYAGSGFHMKLVLDRTVPPRRERPVPIALPPIHSAADIPRAMNAVAAALARGTITTGQAAELSVFVANLLRAVEVGEFDRRLTAIEHGDPPA